MPEFIPKTVIYPAAGKHEILVAGEVDGELRNITVTDENLAAEYRALEAAHNQIVADAIKDRDAARANLDTQASNLAVAKFVNDNTPTPAEVEAE